MMKLTKSIFIAFMVGYHFRSTASQTEKSAPISGNVTFECRLCNSTCERVHWRKKNITVYTFNVETNNTDKNEDKQRYRSSNDGSRFMITEIEKSDEGNYSCKVSAHEHILEQGFYLHVSVTDQERGTSPTVPTTPRITSLQATSPDFDERWLGLIILLVILVIIVILIILFVKVMGKCSLCGSQQGDDTRRPEKDLKGSHASGDDASMELLNNTDGDSSDRPGEGLNVSHALVHGNCPPGSSECNDHPPMLAQNSTTSGGLDPNHPGRSASSTLSFHTCRNVSQGDDASIELHTCGDSSDKPEEDLNVHVSHALFIEQPSCSLPGETLGSRSHFTESSTHHNPSDAATTSPGNISMSKNTSQHLSEQPSCSLSGRTQGNGSYCTESSTLHDPSDAATTSPGNISMTTNTSQHLVLSPAESSNCSNVPDIMLRDISRHLDTSSTSSSSLSLNYVKISSPQGISTSLTVSSQQGTLTPSSAPNPDCTQISSPQGTSTSLTVSSQQGTLTPSSAPNPDCMQISSPPGTSTSLTVSSQQGTLTPSSVPNPDCTQTQQTTNKLSPVGPVLLDDLYRLYSVPSSERKRQLKSDMRKNLHLLVEKCKGEGRSPRLNRNLKAVMEYVKSGKRDFPECIQEDVGYFLDVLDLIPDGRKRDVCEVWLTMPKNQQGYDKSKWCANKFLEPDQQDHQESTIGQKTDSSSRSKQLIEEMKFLLTSSKTKSKRDAARNGISLIILHGLSGHSEINQQTTSRYSKPANEMEQETSNQSDYDRESEDDNLISFWMSKVLKLKGTLQRRVLDWLGDLDRDPQSAYQDTAENNEKDYTENVANVKINKSKEETEMAPKKIACKEILDSDKLVGKKDKAALAPKRKDPTSTGGGSSETVEKRIVLEKKNFPTSEG